jgi:hypothetical protein
MPSFFFVRLATLSRFAFDFRKPQTPPPPTPCTTPHFVPSISLVKFTLWFYSLELSLALALVEKAHPINKIDQSNQL